MPYVAPGLIAVVTSPLVYTETDADGKPVGETVQYKRGDVIHDELLMKVLHDRHFHHALTVTSHHKDLCPDDCATLAVTKPATKPTPTPPPPFSSAATSSSLGGATSTPSAEVK